MTITFYEDRWNDLFDDLECRLTATDHLDCLENRKIIILGDRKVFERQVDKMLRERLRLIMKTLPKEQSYE